MLLNEAKIGIPSTFPKNQVSHPPQARQAWQKAPVLIHHGLVPVT